MATTVTVSSKFQIVIPKAVREAMRLEAGQKFVLLPVGEVLHMVPQRDLPSARGWLKGANTDDTRDRSDKE